MNASIGLLGTTPAGWITRIALAAAILLAPLIFSDFFISALLTQALWLGLIALSLIFLSSYGGMVSLAQVGIFGIAAVTMANLADAEGGLSVAMNPWLASLLGILLAVVVALIFGAISARSEGIYFLMITLAFGVMVFFFVGQVTEISGHGGVNNIEIPGFVGDRVNDPEPLYYVSAAIAAIATLALLYLSRTPFGLSLQGTRDEPARMRALGYNVELHRTLAFGVAGLVAAIAGVMFIWYNRRVGPGTVNLGSVIDVLVVAVIGGLYRLHGAWVGALAFVLLDNYSRSWTPEIGSILGADRFNTLLGLVFLAIILISPGGLVGLWEQARDWLRTRFGRGPDSGDPGERSRGSPGEDDGNRGPVADGLRPGALET